MALIPVTPERTAYSKDLGTAIAFLTGEHPRVPAAEMLAVQAQLIGHCIAGAFPQSEWPGMLEAMMKNISMRLQAVPDSPNHDAPT